MNYRTSIRIGLLTGIGYGLSTLSGTIRNDDWLSIFLSIAGVSILILTVTDAVLEGYKIGYADALNNKEVEL